MEADGAPESFSVDKNACISTRVPRCRNSLYNCGFLSAETQSRALFILSVNLNTFVIKSLLACRTCGGGP